MLKFNSVLVCSGFIAVFAVSAFSALAAPGENVGYTNTTFIPGTLWHVPAGTRPAPRVVTSGASFSHQAPPPSDAIVLFDGTDLSKWRSGDGMAKWKVENGYMEVAPKSGSIQTKD